MHRREALVLLWLASAGACVSHRNFSPRENQNGAGPTGRPAAVYTIAQGDARGEVRLWSAGADVVDADGASMLELHLGFELENTGQQVLQLAVETLQCEEVVVSEQKRPPCAPVRVVGAPAAAPGTTGRFEAWFRPGPGGPRDLESFAVRFRVDGPQGEVLQQVVPFVPYVPGGSRYDDPWYWRSGIGFGFYGRYRRW